MIQEEKKSVILHIVFVLTLKILNDGRFQVIEMKKKKKSEIKSCINHVYLKKNEKRKKKRKRKKIHQYQSDATLLLNLKYLSLFHI